MKKFIHIITVVLFVLFFVGSSLADEGGMGLDDLYDDEEDQTMEEEEIDTSGSIRGISPISQKYGEEKEDLSPYIKDVRSMEERKVSKKEMEGFLEEQGLAKRRFKKLR